MAVSSLSREVLGCFLGLCEVPRAHGGVPGSGWWEVPINQGSKWEIPEEGLRMFWHIRGRCAGYALFAALAAYVLQAPGVPGASEDMAGHRSGALDWLQSNSLMSLLGLVVWSWAAGALVVASGITWGATLLFHPGPGWARTGRALGMLAVLLTVAAGMGASAGVWMLSTSNPSAAAGWGVGGWGHPASTLLPCVIRMKGAGQGGFAGVRVGEASHPGPGEHAEPAWAVTEQPKRDRTASCRACGQAFAGGEARVMS